MYCRNCGNKLDDNDIFCAECGQKIISDQEQNDDKTLQEQKVTVSQEQALNTTQKVVVVRKKSRFLPVLLIVLIIAGIAVFFDSFYINMSPEIVAKTYLKSMKKQDVNLLLKCYPDFMIEKIAEEGGLSKNATRKQIVNEYNKRLKRGEFDLEEYGELKITSVKADEKYSLKKLREYFVSDDVLDLVDEVTKINIQYTYKFEGKEVESDIGIICIKIQHKWYVLSGI